MKNTKTNFEKRDQINKLTRIINSRLDDIQTLKGGWIMTNKVLRLVFKEHPQLEEEFEMLQTRRDNLRQAFWNIDLTTTNK